MKSLFYELQNLYLESPWWFRKSVGCVGRFVPLNCLYGREFIKTSRFLETSQYWSSKGHTEYQFRNLKILLQHAYNNVPYYKELFNSIGFQPGDFSDLSDIKGIPYLTKETIIHNLEKLIATNISSKDLQKVTTGGSTGKPMVFFMEKARTRQREKAFMYQQWKRMGFRLRDRVAVLRGSLPSKNRWYDFDPLMNSLVLSSFQLSDKSVRMYANKINEFQPKFLHVYPSTAMLLATLMLNNDLKLNYKLQAIFCGSEKLYPSQRESLQTVFDCKIYSWYGQSEYVALAGECEYSQYYHIFPEYGYVELVEGNGKPYDIGQNVYEIVATGFNNYALPFIRYRTGDYAIPADYERCACGRNYPLIKEVIGRKQDYILTSDKRFISLTGLIFGQHFNAFAKIKKMQLIQNKVGEVEIRIVPYDTYQRQDEKEINDRVMECVGNTGLKLTFSYVSEIPATSTGKHLFLKQNLGLELNLDM